MTTWKKLAVTCATFFTFTCTSFATTLASEGGDLGDWSTPTPLAQINQAGIFNVYGNVSYASGDYYDAFVINLTPGLRITQIDWWAKNITDQRDIVSEYNVNVGFSSDSYPTPDFWPNAWNVYDPWLEDDWRSSTHWDLYFNFDHIKYASSAGGALYQNGEMSIWPGTGAGYYWEYQFTVEGSPLQPSNPVPEPGTFLLFGAGLAGFALIRKRSK